MAILSPGILKGIFLLWLADVCVGISYGAVSTSYGFDWWIPVLMAFMVVAGSAEFLFIGIVGAGGSMASAILAGLIVNSRHIPYGFISAPLVGRGIKRLVGAHITNDESVAFAMAETDMRYKKNAFWMCGISILVSWPLGTILGVELGKILGDVTTWGIDTIFPTAMLALIISEVQRKEIFPGAIFGLLVSLITVWFIPPGISILASLVGMVIVIWQLRKIGHDA